MIRVRARIRAVVCLGVSLAGLAGCAGILGIEDRTADDGDGAASGSNTGLPDGGGASGASGTTTGSSAGTAGTAGKSGTSGASGATGASGAAGSSGAAAGAAGASGASGTTTGAAGAAGSSGSSGAPDASADAHAAPDTGIVDAGALPDVQLTTCTTPCPVKTGLNNPWAIASDTSRVYWVEYGTASGTSNGVAASCPLAGCDTGMVTYTASQVNPEGIAVYGASVYWGSTGGIWTCPTAGCSGSPTKVANADNPWGIAVDATYVYWAENVDDNVKRAVKTPPDGGLSTATVIDTGSDGITEPEQIAIDANYVYVNDVNGNLWRVPIAGGTATGMDEGPLGGVNFGIALDSASVYYGEPDAIIGESKSGTDGGTQLTSDVHWAQGLALDTATEFLYWANSGSGTNGVSDGTVGRVKADGTGELTMATAQTAPFGITVSGANIYWIDIGTPTSSGSVGSVPNTGAVYRMAK